MKLFGVWNTESRKKRKEERLQKAHFARHAAPNSSYAQNTTGDVRSSIPPGTFGT